MNTLKRSNAIIYAIVLHIIVLSVLFFNFNSKPTRRMSFSEKSKPIEIIKAVSVNAQAVQAEVRKIQQERKQRKLSEQRYQRKLKRDIELAKRKRIQEHKRLQELRKQAKKAEQERKKHVLAQKTEIAALKKQQQAEAQRVNKLKQQKLKLKQQQAAEAKQLVKLKAEKMVKRKAKAKQAAEQKRQAEIASRNAQLKRTMDRYSALILKTIQSHWILPANVDRNLSCLIQVHVAPGGAVLTVKVLKSSGNPVLDRSATAAVYKSSPLPVPTEADMFNRFRQIRLTVRPEGIVSTRS